MKFIFSLFFFVLSLGVQASSQLKLSTTLNETRMGKWVQNDFSIWIDMNELEHFFKEAIGGFTYSLNNYTFVDSSGITFYQNSIRRYETAIAQLKKAPHGFDLRTLIVYRGIDHHNNDKGNSMEVENRMKQMLKAGQAVVYFKGKRIDALQMKDEPFGDDPLSHGTCISYYYQNLNYVLFKDCVVYGW